MLESELIKQEDDTLKEEKDIKIELDLNEIVLLSNKQKFIESTEGEETAETAETENIEIKRKSKKHRKRGKKPIFLPRKNSGAFIFFLKQKRADYKLKHSKIINKEFIKQMAEIWKKMSDTDKVLYFQLAAEDKRRFNLHKTNCQRFLLKQTKIEDYFKIKKQ